MPVPLQDLCDTKLQEYGLSPSSNLSVIDTLGITLDLLKGRILDVGTGGGRALEQALLLGKDIYGIDIALRARVCNAPVLGTSNIRQSLALENLQRVIRQYPGRIKEADATVAIPFPDNHFDTVIACVSLPAYCRNSVEAITSILEMIRVSSDKVYFSANYPSVPSGGQKADLGVGATHFKFKLAQLLHDLKNQGIKFTWKEVVNPSPYSDGKLVSAHLDVTNKNNRKLSLFREQLLSTPGIY